MESQKVLQDAYNTVNPIKGSLRQVRW